MTSPKSYVPVPDSERAPLLGARCVDPADPREIAEVVVVVRTRPSGTGLDSFIEKMANQRVADRRYLRREEFAAEYGADQAGIFKVEQFASACDLAVVEVNPAQRFVRLTGTLDNLAEAFNVELSIFEYPGGKYLGQEGPIYLPSELAGVVEAIIGLDARPQGKPHTCSIRDPGGGWLSNALPAFTPSQIANLYNFPNGVNGRGQCIAILEFGGGFRTSDLTSYFRGLGIPTPSVVAISVEGAQNSSTGDPHGADASVMADIEVIGALAPAAQIVVYFAPNTSVGYLRAISTAIHDSFHNPSVISVTWGGPEATWSRQMLHVLNTEFQVAAALGITVCAAAGVNGFSDGLPGTRANVDFPASSPYVLACGGTSLESSGVSILSETVWNDGPDPAYPHSATGGGVSTVFQLPPYQLSANVPPSVNPPHDRGRGVPDVAGNADPNTGYRVRVDGIDLIMGGTGAVAALWAGLTALFNQNFGKPVGFLNPLLYTEGVSVRGFHDITRGSNGAYQAGPGWDACTGFGTPDGTKLLGAL